MDRAVVVKQRGSLRFVHIETLLYLWGISIHVLGIFIGTLSLQELVSIRSVKVRFTRRLLGDIELKIMGLLLCLFLKLLLLFCKILIEKLVHVKVAVNFLYRNHLLPPQFFNDLKVGDMQSVLLPLELH